MRPPWPPVAWRAYARRSAGWVGGGARLRLFLVLPLGFPSAPLPFRALCTRGGAGGRHTRLVVRSIRPLLPLLPCHALAWPGVLLEGGGALLRPYQALSLAPLSYTLPPRAPCTQGGAGGRLVRRIVHSFRPPWPLVLLAAFDWSVVLCEGRNSPHRPILALLLVPLSSPLPPLAFCMRGGAGSRCAHHMGGALWPIRPLLRCGAYAWPSVWCGGGGSRLRPCQALPLASLSSPLPPFAFCTRGGVGGRLSCCTVPYNIALWTFVPHVPPLPVRRCCVREGMPSTGPIRPSL